ncbi:hypothetical protein [Arenibaculum pallidiluteum]|uniref:hypothetical protein n=1 Tax=Arenibaculum pallidiluteum TaxID=2812559 RepID=UPI001A97455B|nr:hypothetical protein [Arenibaculum pallidiluteum]
MSSVHRAFSQVSPVAELYKVAVETDDRTFLFPAGKYVSQVVVSAHGDRTVRLSAIFGFNESHTDPEFARFGLDEARDLARAMVEAVYQGRTQHVLSDAAKAAIVFNPNGFVLRFGEGAALVELFIASPAILRLAQGIMRAVDRLEAPAPH